MYWGVITSNFHLLLLIPYIQMKNHNKSMYTCITTSKVNIKQHEESMKIKLSRHKCIFQINRV